MKLERCTLVSSRVVDLSLLSSREVSIETPNFFRCLPCRARNLLCYRGCAGVCPDRAHQAADHRADIYSRGHGRTRSGDHGVESGRDQAFLRAARRKRRAGRIVVRGCGDRGEKSAGDSGETGVAGARLRQGKRRTRKKTAYTLSPGRVFVVARFQTSDLRLAGTALALL